MPATIGVLAACGDGADTSTGPGDGSGEITTLRSAKTRVSAGGIAANDLDQALASRGRDLPAQADGTGFQLSIANSIWAQKEFGFEEGFLDLLAQQYGRAWCPQPQVSKFHAPCSWPWDVTSST